MTTIIAALIVASAIGAGFAQVVAELKRQREESRRTRQLSIAALFAPAIAAAHADPRVLLTWQPLARTLRPLFAAEFTALDAESGARFPFSSDMLTSAHARWTADWLAWEKAHDAEYKLKALVAQEQVRGDASSAAARSKLDAIEREKLEMYQRRYEEYVRVGKALQALAN